MFLCLIQLRALSDKRIEALDVNTGYATKMPQKRASKTSYMKICGLSAVSQSYSVVGLAIGWS